MAKAKAIKTGIEVRRNWFHFPIKGNACFLKNKVYHMAQEINLATK